VAVAKRTGLSQADDEGQVEHMGTARKCILSRVVCKRGAQSRCGAESIKGLIAKTGFDEDLVNALGGMTDATNIVTLSAVAYTEVENPNWETWAGWVGGISRNHSDWIWPIQDGEFWQVVLIKWSAMQIFCYNPVCSADAGRRNIQVLRVCHVVICAFSFPY
jgi:hypothetical protein